MVKLFTRRKHPPLSVNMLWLNAVFCLFYWIMESVRDVVVFGKGSIPARIFHPDPMSFWMRMLVIFIFILFSIYSNTLREKIEIKKAKVSRVIEAYGIILTGAVFALAYWFLEAFRDVFVFGRGNLLDRLIFPDAMAFWMRIMVIFTLMLFSAYAQALINKYRKIEEKLKKAYVELEQQVLDRTLELSRSKEMMQHHASMREKTETAMRRMNLNLNMLSACDEILKQPGDEKHLLQEICGAIASMGGYPLVWITYAEQNGEWKVQPVSQCVTRSMDGKLIALTLDDFTDGQNPVGQALRTGLTSLVRNFSRQIEAKFWVAAAMKCRYTSLLSLPLKNDERVFGSLSMYASDPNAFDAEESRLLQTVADHLAFGITAARSRHQAAPSKTEKQTPKTG